MSLLSPAPTARFGNRVADYEAARPGYPEPLWDYLAERHGLAPGQAVVDVGAGTGLSARPLLERGCRVVAVEPNAAMRDAVSRALGGFEHFAAVDGTAEAMAVDSASTDWVVAAQAFHWFEPSAFARESMRILAPGGRVALIWNVRRLAGTDFLVAYEAFLHAHGTDYAKVAAYRGEDEIREALGPDAAPEATFENIQRLDRAGLHARIASCSYMPGRDHERFEAMSTAVDVLFDAHAEQGGVTLIYDTVVVVGQPSV